MTDSINQIISTPIVQAYIPKPQHYLPYIFLLLTLALAYFPPPFRGRAPILVSLTIFLEWQCITSPWPPNEGDTRPMRYGIACPWFFIVPVVERLLLHNPETEFRKVDDDDNDNEVNDESKPIQSKKLKKQPEQQLERPPKEFSLSKLAWSLALFSTPRAVGWNFGSKQFNAQRASLRKLRMQGTLSRPKFIALKIRDILTTYLLWDAAMIALSHLPFPTPNLNHRNWKSPSETIQTAYLELLMITIVRSGMTLQFDTAAAISVGLRLSEPEVSSSFQVPFPSPQ